MVKKKNNEAWDILQKQFQSPTSTPGRGTPTPRRGTSEQKSKRSECNEIEAWLKKSNLSPPLKKTTKFTSLKTGVAKGGRSSASFSTTEYSTTDHSTIGRMTDHSTTEYTTDESIENSTSERTTDEVIESFRRVVVENFPERFSKIKALEGDDATEAVNRALVDIFTKSLAIVDKKLEGDGDDSNVKKDTTSIKVKVKDDGDIDDLVGDDLSPRDHEIVNECFDLRCKAYSMQGDVTITNKMEDSLTAYSAPVIKEEKKDDINTYPAPVVKEEEEDVHNKRKNPSTPTMMSTSPPLTRTKKKGVMKGLKDFSRRLSGAKKP